VGLLFVIRARNTSKISPVTHPSGGPPTPIYTTSGDSYLRRAAGVGLEVEVTQSDPIPVVDVSDDGIADWLAARRLSLLRPVQSLSRGDVEDARGGRRGARTVEEFRAEVEAYLAEASSVLVDAALDAAVIQGASVTFTVTNPTDQHLLDVRLDVSFDSTVRLAEPRRPAWDLASLPDEPQAWRSVRTAVRPGTWTGLDTLSSRMDLGALSSISGLSPITIPTLPDPLWVSCDNTNGVVRWADFELRTQYQRTMKEFRLVAASPAAEVRGTWVATAAGLSGRAQGDILLRASDTAVSLADALATEST
jgi:hypothetical protein